MLASASPRRDSARPHCKCAALPAGLPEGGRLRRAAAHPSERPSPARCVPGTWAMEEETRKWAKHGGLATVLGLPE
jgi:hypothetical protein